MRTTVDGAKRASVRAPLGAAIAMVMIAGACSTPAPALDPADSPTTTTTTTAATTSTTTATARPAITSTTAAATTTTTISPFARPDWLGTRLLPLREDGFGEVLPTPAALIDRRFTTPDLLPRPTTDEFVATTGPVPADVVARSTWRQGCPVPIDDLRYLTASHYGFDGELHTGELIVNAAVADDIVWVLEQLFDAKYPIEELRVTRADELDAPPTGDGNRSGSYGCRPVAGRDTGWSQHAYGLAIDINPFHNPYRKGDLVLPELASFYLDRSLDLPGMISPDSVVVAAFTEIGWTWGGTWRSLDDYMHFSQNGH